MTREEALRVGSSKYFTGKPCARGHICERRTLNRACLKCANLASATLRARKSKNNKVWLRAQKDRINAYRKNKRAIDPVWKANRDKTIRECYAKAVAADPVSYRIKWRNERAKKRNAEGSYSVEDIERLLKKQKFKCLCGALFLFRVYTVDHTVDHIVPLSRGGSNWPRNLQLLCGSCNDSKGAKLMSEWRPQWQ